MQWVTKNFMWLHLYSFYCSGLEQRSACTGVVQNLSFSHTVPVLELEWSLRSHSISGREKLASSRKMPKGSLVLFTFLNWVMMDQYILMGRFPSTYLMLSGEESSFQGLFSFECSCCFKASLRHFRVEETSESKVPPPADRACTGA